MKVKPLGNESFSRPKIISQKADRAFAAQAHAMGLDPTNPWIGSYVDYEFDHLWPILNAYALEVSGKKILEFGCNVGASAIIFSTLGASVHAVDISAQMVKLASINAQRYGLSQLQFSCIPDTRYLAFEDKSFDIISCNSVLEYVDKNHLSDVMYELDRILKPHGKILITGTSSRLWPKEIHTGRWLVNYVPSIVDRLFLGGKTLTRGIWPWKIRYGFGPHYQNLDAKDHGIAFLKSRSMMAPPNINSAVRAMATTASLLGMGPGLLAPNISCLLEKI